MSIKNLLELFTGIAMFLFGMSLMGDGLKKVAGNKLEVILYKLTGSPLKGMLFGTGITTVIQSSSATSVMVVGFVNSGMMKLKQAIPVVLGAILGTSITGWVICLSMLDGASGWISLFSTTTLTCATALIGILFRMFTKNRFKNHLADVLLGFTVLMVGMSNMSGAVSPLRESEMFIRLLTTFSNPIIGILVGTAFTCVIQSASAAVGILQALTLTGTIQFDMALPLIIGIAIGAAVPVLLSAVGASRDGMRTAFSYLISNVVGGLLFGGIFYTINAFMHFDFMSRIMTVVSVAVLNSVYRFIIVAVLLPFIKQLETISGWFAKERDEEDNEGFKLVALEDRFITHPSLAVEQCRTAINDMSQRAMDNLLLSLKLLHAYSDVEHEHVKMEERAVDQYEDQLGTYLIKVNAVELNEEQNKSLSKFLHTIADFERISDHAMNLADSAKEIYEKKTTLSKHALQELSIIESALTEVIEMAVHSFQDNNLFNANKVEPLEEVIDNLCDEAKLHHVERLRQGFCSIESGFVFNDILTSYERVADHCSNIAVALIELESESFDTHAYLRNVKKQKLERFDEYYDEYAKKYNFN